MRTNNYDATDLAPWDPWNGRDEPQAAVLPRADVPHARARLKLARCRVDLLDARLALDRSGSEEPKEELLARLETARLLFLDAERTVADLERLLARTPAAAGSGYPPSEP